MSTHGAIGGLTGCASAGIQETQGPDEAFHDAPERQEQAPQELHPASEAPPVAQVPPPAPPSTPISSPALSAAQIAPETPTRARCSPCSTELPNPHPWLSCGQVVRR